MSGGDIVPAYKNIESDNEWVATHRLRKGQLNSAIYAPNSNPGTGTFNAVAPDGDNYVVAELQPDSGAWLPAGKPFCAFAFEIHATTRATNGYGLPGSHRLDLELVGIQLPPSP